jgi:hypothetical protein
LHILGQPNTFLAPAGEWDALAADPDRKVEIHAFQRLDDGAPAQGSAELCTAAHPLYTGMYIDLPPYSAPLLLKRPARIVKFILTPPCTFQSGFSMPNTQGPLHRPSPPTGATMVVETSSEGHACRLLEIDQGGAVRLEFPLVTNRAANPWHRGAARPPWSDDCIRFLPTSH